ncbi:MAG: hypothetical protein ABR540_05500 [Acidimicrobiales bacterium]
MLYAIACTATQPLHARDFVRNAERDYGSIFGLATALAMLADPRFCWAGKGLYGLYRHGPLPGPRNLEEATRLVLVAADAPLGQEAVDFCLKQLGYRYSVGSLRNAVSRSESVAWLTSGFWDHNRGDDAEWELLHDMRVVPLGEWDAWALLRTDIGVKVARTREKLRTRLGAIGDYRFGLDWDPTRSE